MVFIGFIKGYIQNMSFENERNNKQDMLKKLKIIINATADVSLAITGSIFASGLMLT